MDHPNMVGITNLKIGDKVRITRKADTEEYGWDSCWLDTMDEWVGKEVTITHIHETVGVLFKEVGYAFPIFVLEKV